MSLRFGRKYNCICIQEALFLNISPPSESGEDEEEEDGIIINNNNRSGSGSFFCIIIDYSRGICRADQESTVPCCRVKSVRCC